MFRVPNEGRGAEGQLSGGITPRDPVVFPNRYQRRFTAGPGANLCARAVWPSSSSAFTSALFTISALIANICPESEARRNRVQPLDAPTPAVDVSGINIGPLLNQGLDRRRVPPT